MFDTLREQYALVLVSRGRLLDFVSGLDTDAPVFNGTSIRFLLEHVASCYIGWLADVGLGEPRWAVTGLPFPEMFARIDDLVSRFLSSAPETPIHAVHDSMGPVTATPVGLFTHVVTHEYHHKGQILMMARMLGAVPVDTDASEAFI